MALDDVVLDDGSVRKFGNIMPDPSVPRVSAFQILPDQHMVAESEYDELLKGFTTGPWDNPFLPPRHQQANRGQCNPEAGTAALEYLRAMQGLPPVALSAGDLYDRINGGGDNGSLLEDAVRVLSQEGVGTDATCGHVWRGQGWKGTAPAAERRKYRFLEVWDCPTFQHCMSAVFKGFGLVSGVIWYGNYNPDSQGWLPMGSRQVGGHAIFGFQPTARMIGGRTTYGIWHAQSWGPDWYPPTKSLFVLRQQQYDGPVGGWYAVRSVVDDGGGVPPLSA